MLSWFANFDKDHIPEGSERQKLSQSFSEESKIHLQNDMTLVLIQPQVYFAIIELLRALTD